MNLVRFEPWSLLDQLNRDLSRRTPRAAAAADAISDWLPAVDIAGYGAMIGNAEVQRRHDRKPGEAADNKTTFDVTQADQAVSIVLFAVKAISDQRAGIEPVAIEELDANIIGTAYRDVLGSRTGVWEDQGISANLIGVGALIGRADADDTANIPGHGGGVVLEIAGQ